MNQKIHQRLLKFRSRLVTNYKLIKPKKQRLSKNNFLKIVYDEHIKPSSLYIDEYGYLFHAGLERTGSVGLIKSPGLSEELYKNLQINENDEIISYENKPVDNQSTKNALKILDDLGYLGKEEFFDEKQS